MDIFFFFFSLRQATTPAASEDDEEIHQRFGGWRRWEEETPNTPAIRTQPEAPGEKNQFKYSRKPHCRLNIFCKYRYITNNKYCHILRCGTEPFFLGSGSRYFFFGYGSGSIYKSSTPTSSGSKKQILKKKKTLNFNK